MKITVTKIQREFIKKFGCSYSNSEIIKEVLIVVDEILRAEKNITILDKKK